MDAPPYNNNTSRVSKLQNSKGNVSPLNTQRDHNSNHQFFVGGGRFHHPSNSPTFDPYTSSFDKSNLENLDPAALIRYLRSVSPASPDAGDGFKTPAVMIGGSGGFGSSSSPLRAVENLVETLPSRSPPVFKTPVKVEEDVLVMDGILVGGSVSGGRMRLSAASDPSGGTPSSGSNSSAYKREICRSWEDSSFCRHGSKCQFAHGKEEVRPSRFPSKTKSEICKSYSGSGSCSYGAKCRFSHHQVITASSPTERAVAAVKAAKTQSISPIKPENSNDSTSSSGSKTIRSSITASSPTERAVAAMKAAKTQSISPIKPENSNDSTSSSGSKTIRSSITVTNTDWSPMDDGIMVSLPSSASVDEIPSREAVDAYINSVLYGPPHGKRLPVFAEICPV